MSATESGGWDRYDVLEFADGETTVYPAGEGDLVIGAHERYARKRQLLATVIVALSLPVVAVIYGSVFLGSIGGHLVVSVLLGFAGAVVRYITWDHGDMVPELLVTGASAQVVESHIEGFDPNEVTSARA